MPQHITHMTLLPELGVLTRPFEVKLLLQSEEPGIEQSLLKNNFQRLISLFDQKEMTALCPSCSRKAKSLVFCKGVFFFELWCGECIPNWLLYPRGKLIRVSRYMNALRYVDDYLFGQEKYYNIIIEKLARLKGLTGVPEALDAMAFFCTEEEVIQDTQTPPEPDSLKTSPDKDLLKSIEPRSETKPEHEFTLIPHRSSSEILYALNNKGSPDFRDKSSLGKQTRAPPYK